MKRRIYAVLVLLLVGLTAGCAGSLQAPHTTNDAVGYAGQSLQSVQQMAISQYPYMTTQQATRVHQMIAQAKVVRREAVAASQAGDEDAAHTRLQTLSTILSQAQAAIREYGHVDEQ